MVLPFFKSLYVQIVLLQPSRGKATTKHLFAHVPGSVSKNCNFLKAEQEKKLGKKSMQTYWLVSPTDMVTEGVTVAAWYRWNTRYSQLY